MQALASITGYRITDAAVTLGDQEVDSSRLVELMVACDEIYEAEVPFEELDISIETSLRSLHDQILLVLTGVARDPTSAQE
jgi:acyl carrier protein